MNQEYKRTLERWGNTILSHSPIQPLFLLKASHRLTILAYHGIEDPERFELHLDYIKRKMSAVTLQEALDAMAGRRGLPKRAVLITFDDGDRSLIDYALPMLRDRNLPAVAFVVAGLLDTNRPYWWNEVKELARNGGTLTGFLRLTPEDLVRALKRVNESQRLEAIEELRTTAKIPASDFPQINRKELLLLESAGIAIGNHSLTHPCLPRCAEEKIISEIEESHKILTEALGKAPLIFAYPNGDSDPRAKPVLQRLGYQAALLFDHRVSALPVHDRFEISRVRVNSTTSMERFQIIVSGLHPALNRMRRPWIYNLKPLKVLFVIDGLGQGGSERSLAELLPCTKSNRIDAALVCLYRRKQGVQEQVIEQGFDVRFLQKKGMIGRILELRRIIKKEKPDVVHTTLFESNVIGRLAAWRCAPVMSSLVNTPYSDVRYRDPGISAWRLKVVQMIDSWTSRHLTAHFHAVSETAKLAACETLHLPAHRVTVVERGRNTARLGKPGADRASRMRAMLGLTADDQVLLNVGRHEYQKGQGFLIEAVARLIPKFPRLVLMIAGREGTNSEHLLRINAKTGVNGAVRFLGHRDDVPDILAAADLFVFPSLYEGLPGAVIEAMALGLPIVGSNIGPLREVIEPEKNGILVKPGSPEELAGAIEKLLNDSDKRLCFGKRSREIFEERFTLERSAARMMELYHQVALMKKGKREEYHPIFLETN